MMCSRVCLIVLLMLITTSLSFAQTQKCTKTAKESTPTSRFENLGEVVKDQTTQKLWLRCALGMQWSGSACEDKTSTYTYIDALSAVEKHNQQKTAGRSNWRLPTRDELLSIVEKRCHNPSINLDVFSYSPQSGFWSSTENPGLLNMRMEIVHFLYGDAFIANKNQSWRVRLVAD